MNTGALAIFVKTPGLSPVKSRLSKTIGEAEATNFYRLSVSATQAVIEQWVRHQRITPYWAIAEEAGRNDWTHFPKIIQAGETLGHRLSFVYNTLLKKHKFVFLIGADSPMLSVDILNEALLYIKNSFVLGRALDGGFYLFGGKKSISEDIWLSISYSVSNTAKQLYKKISPWGPVHELPPLLDIDIYDDLKKMYVNYKASQDLWPDQKKIIAWIEMTLL